MCKNRIEIEELPSEDWFFEAEKEVEDVYISSLTCENVTEPLSKISEFEYFKCTYCERSDHCYKNSLNFKELVNKEHLDILSNLKNDQIEDIIYDLKRVRFNCPDCLEDEDEKESCYSCNGIKINGFHQFISKLEKVNAFDTINNFIEVSKNI